MPVTGPKTGFTFVDPSTSVKLDLGNRYISKDYLIDMYPNLIPSIKSPGLWMGGLTAAGQLGNGNADPDYAWSLVHVGITSSSVSSTRNDWSQVSIGGSTSLSIKTDGTLWTWGYNAYGQLGKGNIVSYSSPVQIGALTNWKYINVTDGSFAGAVKTDGTLWAWGYNDSGQIGNSSRASYSSPIQIGSLTNWKQVYGCGGTIAAVKTDGTLWAWGYNYYGQLGNSSSASYSSPIQIGSLTNWKQVSVTMNGSVTAVKTDGTLWVWGYNNHGQSGNGSDSTYSSPIQVGTLTNWKQVSCGYSVTLSVKTDGTLWAWGYNYYGQLGNSSRTSYSSPIQIGSLTNWKQVSVGGSTLTAVMAIKTDGTLWGWGNDNNRALCTIDNYVAAGGLSIIPGATYSSPIQIGALTNWKNVTTTGNFTAILADGYI